MRQLDTGATEATLRAVLDTTPDGVLAIDRSGVIESANTSALSMFRGPLVGMRFGHLLEPRDEGMPLAGIVHELVARRADGTTFPLEVVLTRIDSAARAVVIAIVRDITARHALEQQLADIGPRMRRQIGQDLHDGLGQLLTGTAFLAQGLKGRVSSEDQAQAERVVELINQAIGRVRNLARGLAPIHVEGQTLRATLREVVLESGRLLGVRCTIEMSDDADELDDEATRTQLCLIVREAITNAVRHGNASRIDVTLTLLAGRAFLAIADDGVGIEPPRDPLQGLGLRSMRQRASALGGTLEVTRQQRGTLVRCAWKVDDGLTLQPDGSPDTRSAPSG